MCGRFAQFSQKIEDQFKAKPKDSSQEFKFNYAPSDKIKAVVKIDERELVLFNWGIITEWSVRKGCGLINIRDDTLIDKKTFYSLFEKNRCLIVADGFYEWKKEPSGGKKTPYYFFMKNKKPFAFAGLWNTWTPPDGNEIRSCAIITTQANSLVKILHDRMPVILNERDYDLWLNTGFFDREKLSSLLKPYPSEEMDSYEVSGAVGNVKNDYEGLIKPYRK